MRLDFLNYFMLKQNLKGKGKIILITNLSDRI